MGRWAEEQGREPREEEGKVGDDIKSRVDSIEYVTTYAYLI